MTQENTVNVDLNTCYKVTDLIEEFGVNKTTFYKDINYLKIEIIKDSKNQSYISEEDYQQILLLRKYIEETGSRKGFGEEKMGRLTVRKSDSISNSKSEKSEVNYDEIYVEPEEPTAGFEDEFMRSAFELKAREIAMPDLVKRAIADQIQEEDLPEDLQEKINNARESANPKFSPSEVATTLLANYKKKLTT